MIGRGHISLVSLAALLALGGCGPKHATLKLDKVRSVTVEPWGGGSRFCTNGLVPLRAVVTYQDGKQAMTYVPQESQRGRLRPTDFAWSSSQGTIEPEALLALPDDVLSWFDTPFRIRVQVVERPTLVGEATLLPAFDCNETADVRGAQGARGGEAEDAGPGEHGHEIDVALGYMQTKHHGRLILIRVQRREREARHFVFDNSDPKTEFVVDARGGAGGWGGQGTIGRDGIAGVRGDDGIDGEGCADGTGGADGTPGGSGEGGGPGANGGRGGDGGRVFLRYDGRFPELPSLIRVRVEGGEAGKAGAGGPGGQGGQGGQGGKGGKGGSDAVARCSGADGQDGAAGSDGADGPTGASGQPGASGNPGKLETSTDSAAELFEAEIAQGVPVLIGGEG